MSVQEPERPFGPHVLDLDCAAEAARIEAAIRAIVGRRLRRRGAVVGVSGGIDSAVCAALSARALGPARVHALLMPGRNSSPASAERGRELCERLGIAYDLIDIGAALEPLGCYRTRDEAIAKLFPDYRPGDRYKIAVAGDLLEKDRLNVFQLIVERDGELRSKRMPLDVYLAIVASTNMKQRMRKLLEYHHAERRNYAVVGTPNRLEYDQGFFVRGGDGLADLKPIAHLYKTQVYALAEYLGVPESIRAQTPSTDTYSLPQTQEEFYFALSYDKMDLMLYAYTNGVPAEEVARGLGLEPRQVERAFRDIEAKRRTAAILHQHALLVADAGGG
ncbi:MAG: NAD(+) synthase [Planctomycetota bacterium]